jgi:outer membrane immunogenic protein
MKLFQQGCLKACLAAGLAVLASQADAADIARPVYKAPVVAPLPAPWAGWYFGGQGGWGKGDPEAIINFAGAPLGGAFTFPPGTAPAPFSLVTEPKGGFGGVVFGFNWQNGILVYGWEADFSFGDIKDSQYASISRFVSDPDNGLFLGNAGLATKLDMFGTLRGRFGFAANNVLFFGSAGLAYGHVKNTVSSSGATYSTGGGTPVLVTGSAFNRSASLDDWNIGFAVGGGIDWLFSPNWVFRVEYLYLDFNGSTYLNPVPMVSSVNTDLFVHTVRVAFTYKLP